MAGPASSLSSVWSDAGGLFVRGPPCLRDFDAVVVGVAEAVAADAVGVEDLDLDFLAEGGDSGG